VGNISVYFKNLNVAGDTTYYHEFIVWTDDNGTRQYIRGGPAANVDFGSNSGGGSGVGGVDAPGSGINLPFGSILVRNGDYTSGSPLAASAFK